MDDVLPAGCALIELRSRGDARGQLIALEGDREVPFAIARVYYIYGTAPGTVRGHHAHRALNQLAICVAGSCTMLLDDGHARARITLDSPARALSIGSMVWREMHDFTPGAVLMVLADRAYDESDYIRDYDRFRALVGAPEVPAGIRGPHVHP